MTVLRYKTLRESIVDIIRKRIINRELQPGQKIVEQELAKEFKTSRAPIREALRVFCVCSFSLLIQISFLSLLSEAS